MNDLENIQVGDSIRVTGEILLRGKVNEVRKVTRVTKTLIIDEKGGRWGKIWGTPPGVEYPTVSIEKV